MGSSTAVIPVPILSECSTKRLASQVDVGYNVKWASCIYSKRFTLVCPWSMGELALLSQRAYLPRSDR